MVVREKAVLLLLSTLASRFLCFPSTQIERSVVIKFRVESVNAAYQASENYGIGEHGALLNSSLDSAFLQGHLRVTRKTHTRFKPRTRTGED